MHRKHPFSTLSITLAILVAFFTGSGVGYVFQFLKPSLLKTSVIQKSAFIRKIAAYDAVERAGELVAYHTSDGELIDDRVADDPEGIAEEPPPLKKEPPKPPPKLVRPKKEVIPEKPKIDCNVPQVEKPEYKGVQLASKRMYKGIPGEAVTVSMMLENTGNMPWFSDESGCKAWTSVQLGTMRQQDRSSIFYTESEESGWIESNRIKMRTPRVDPGEAGVFEFIASLPQREDIYREYFALVIPGRQWIDASEFSVDFVAGEPYEKGEMLRRFNYLNDSSPGHIIDLQAKRSLEIDISEQVGSMKLGDYVVRKFLLSTGTVKNPTPSANWTIKFHQKWRIGAKSPYYIMPKFMGLDRGYGFEGFGLHALPSLGDAELRTRIRKLGPDTAIPTEWFGKDSMWSEARDHIGSRRSHGCIRFLPEDADFLFDFAEDGTEVVTHD